MIPDMISDMSDLNKNISELTTLSDNIRQLLNNVEDITKKKKDSESMICNICCDNKIDIAFLPCGHMVCCQECSKDALKTTDSNSYYGYMYSTQPEKCPMCKQNVTTKQKVYF